MMRFEVYCDCSVYIFELLYGVLVLAAGGHGDLQAGDVIPALVRIAIQDVHLHVGGLVDDILIHESGRRSFLYRAHVLHAQIPVDAEVLVGAILIQVGG